MHLFFKQNIKKRFFTKCSKRLSCKRAKPFSVFLKIIKSEIKSGIFASKINKSGKYFPLLFSYFLV